MESFEIQSHHWSMKYIMYTNLIVVYLARTIPVK